MLRNAPKGLHSLTLAQVGGGVVFGGFRRGALNGTDVLGDLSAVFLIREKCSNISLQNN